jgi:hypothetical protein
MSATTRWIASTVPAHFGIAPIHETRGYAGWFESV